MSRATSISHGAFKLPSTFRRTAVRRSPRGWRIWTSTATATHDLLPGAAVNAFDRGLDQADLVRLVDAYNQQVAERSLCCGQTARRITLPAAYRFFDNFFTQDLRVTRVLTLGPHVRLAVFGEVFNLFNTANLIGYNGNLLSPAFGQQRASRKSSARAARAFQFGARASF